MQDGAPVRPAVLARQYGRSWTCDALTAVPQFDTGLTGAGFGLILAAHPCGQFLATMEVAAMKGQSRVFRWLAASIASVAVIVLMLLWLAGVFKSKVSPSDTAALERRPLGDRAVITVSESSRPYAEWAVGTTRAVRETTLGSRLLARVLAVNVRAGDEVKEGQVLVELDDADLKAQLDQAEAVLAASKAALDQARTEHDRIKGLTTREAATPLELTTVVNALRGAEANVQRAGKARDEAQTRLSFATVRAPMSGRIVDKRANVGDTVTPGQPLVSLYDNTRMQMVAVVRESLAERLKAGQVVAVRLEALGKECDGVVEEVVPQSEAASRSFEIKVSGPCPPGIYPGMFGRVRIPLDPQQLVSVPQAAVQRVGQLDFVDVVNGQELDRRLVRLGRTLDDGVEVLSGLAAGERIAMGKW